MLLDWKLEDMGSNPISVTKYGSIAHSMEQLSGGRLKSYELLDPPMLMTDKESSKKYYSKHKERLNAQRRKARRSNIAQAVLSDSRKSDKKKARLNDLDLAFVKILVESPCSYCGEDQLRMTLDRLDNKLGHTKANVVGACERCNYIRRDMPIAAWKVLSQGIKSVREQNLFGDWTGVIHKRDKEIVIPESLVKPPNHGTITMYTHHKCRCDLCKLAMRNGKRLYRKSGVYNEPGGSDRLSIGCSEGSNPR